MDDHVKIPETADEAAAMLRVSVLWLSQRAPDVLRAVMRATADAKEAERYRWLRHGDNDERVMAFAENGDPYLPRNGDLDKAVDHWIAYDADEINHTVAAPAVGAA